MHHVVPSLQNLSQRPSPSRSSLKPLLFCLVLLVLFSLNATDPSRSDSSHPRSTVVKFNLLVDERLSGVKEEGLGVVGTCLVESDGGGEDGSSVEEEVEVEGSVWKREENEMRVSTLKQFRG